MTVQKPVLQVQEVSVHYGTKKVLDNVTFDIPTNQITSIIGPSGCGKSTLLRSFNRMNDLISSAVVSGQIIFHGQNIYEPHLDPTEIRYQMGMVFQKPNPFPKSIYDNIAFGPKVAGFNGDMDELVETSLKKSALWEEVKDRLKDSALALSGGQQQRLCIARALAVEPEVILMDEPCSALDPISTLAIEQLMRELRENYSIVIVTHNMQQASRVSDKTAFFMNEGDNIGLLIEYGDTDQIFSNPEHKTTEDYITGRFG